MDDPNLTGTGPEQGSESPAPQEPRNAEEFFANVLQDLEQGEQQTETQAETQPEAEATAEPVQAESEPESIAWIKKISGNVREDGTVDLGRVADQAFNLNKQNQEQARRIAEIERVLKNPIIAAALERVSRGETPAAPAKEEPDKEKTDEEIIAEFVKKQVEPQFNTMQQTIQMLLADKVKGEVERSIATIKSEFSDYDQYREEVGALLSDAATEAGMNLPQLIQQLALAGKLEKTLRSAVVNVSYPKLRDRLSETNKKVEAKSQSEQAKAATVDRALKAKLPGKTTSGAKVGSDRKVTTFEEAAAQAEAELAEAS